MTQKELAEKCSITARSIQRIEAGEVLPRAYTFKALSQVLELDLTNFDPIGLIFLCIARIMEIISMYRINIVIANEERVSVKIN